MSKVALKKNEKTLLKVVAAVWVVTAVFLVLGIAMLCSLTSRQPLSREDVARMVQMSEQQVESQTPTQSSSFEYGFDAPTSVPSITPTPSPTQRPATSMGTSPTLEMFFAESEVPTLAPQVENTMMPSTTTQRGSSSGADQVVIGVQPENSVLSNVIKLGSLGIILFLSFSLGWTEVIVRMQTGDMIAAFMALLCLAGTMALAWFMPVLNWLPYLIFVVGGLIAHLACKKGKTDYSPMSFFLGGTGIIVFVVAPYINYIPATDVVGIILMILGARIALLEIDREDVPKRSIALVVTYVLLQVGAMSLSVALAITPIIGIILVHIGLMFVSGGIARIISVSAVKFKFVTDEMQWKPSHVIPLDALILINMVIGILIALLAR